MQYQKSVIGSNRSSVSNTSRAAQIKGVNMMEMKDKTTLFKKKEIYVSDQSKDPEEVILYTGKDQRSTNQVERIKITMNGIYKDRQNLEMSREAMIRILCNLMDIDWRKEDQYIINLNKIEKVYNQMTKKLKKGNRKFKEKKKN